MLLIDVAMLRDSNYVHSAVRGNIHGCSISDPESSLDPCSAVVAPRVIQVSELAIPQWLGSPSTSSRLPELYAMRVARMFLRPARFSVRPALSGACEPALKLFFRTSWLSARYAQKLRSDR